MLVIEHIRFKFLEDRTLGHISLPDSDKKIYTLEDKVRPSGVKVYGETAIPSNHYGYSVNILYSNKFKRDMLVLSNCVDKFTIDLNGVKFQYVYVHGGNTPKDTLGCILIAHTINLENNTIYKTAEKYLFNYISPYILKGEDVKWVII